MAGETAAGMRAAIAADPAASRWLKEAAEALAARDPLDALGDAEALLALAELRWQEALAAARRPA